MSARQLFGISTAVWGGVLHEVGEHGWSSFSGADSADYNLSLVHGGDVKSEVSDTLELIEEASVPAIVMLAGEGLAGAQVLVDAGWVNIGAMPFMVREPREKQTDPAVRELTEEDLPAARELARGAFGVGSEVSSLIFSPNILKRPDSLLGGLFEDGDLVACALLCRAPGVSTGWALATAAGRRRGGYATRVVEGGLGLDFEHRGSTANYCLSTPMAKPLYDALGFETVEYWQTWSRPRWIMGAS